MFGLNAALQTNYELLRDALNVSAGRKSRGTETMGCVVADELKKGESRASAVDLASSSGRLVIKSRPPTLKIPMPSAPKG